MTPLALDAPPAQTQNAAPTTSPGACAQGSRVDQAMQALAEAFYRPFALVDVATGAVQEVASTGLYCDLYDRLGVLAEVAERGKPEIIEEAAPLSLLAIPLQSLGVDSSLVATGLFLSHPLNDRSEIAHASRVFGIDAERAYAGARRMDLWSPKSLLRLAERTLEIQRQQRLIEHLQRERDEAVAHTVDTYVELDLLHRVTRHLHLCQSEATLWKDTLEWLFEAIPAQCLAVATKTAAGSGKQEIQLGNRSGVLTVGECPLETAELFQLVNSLQSKIAKQTFVLSRAQTSLPTWYYATVRELICVPLKRANRQQGWLLALNHRGTNAGELGAFGAFGSVETQLLESVSTILSVHSSNRTRFQEQADLFSSAVRALTSAIDAKDRYTSGHSDRVARISVCLAQELGLSQEDLETIYLGGLLHDIGKIGIDDQVLNKPGELTAEEFEHIKLHPQFGYEILQGVRQLDKILPLVLHHHEAWDGSGYPHGLVGEQTPRLARIVAVADAFDAMGSDRPYRKGMPDERLDAVLRQGAGQQWDAEVVKALFRVREQLRQIANSEANGVVASLDGSNWVG